MALEIPGNGYSFVLDDNGTVCDLLWKKFFNNPQKIFTRKFNRLGKDLMTLPDFYAFAVYAKNVLENDGNKAIKYEVLNTKINLLKTINFNHVVTGTGIYIEKDSRDGTFIQHKYSTITKSTKTYSSVPIFDGGTVYRDKPTEEFLQRLLSTKDGLNTILENIGYLSLSGHTSPVFITPKDELIRKKKYWQSTITSWQNNFIIGYNSTETYDTRHAWGVKYRQNQRSSIDTKVK